MKPSLFTMILNALENKLMCYPRRKYHQHKAKRNRNNNPSIICNNCTAGVLLSDLNLKFNTPTINTGIRNPEEFIYFVENIEDFMTAEMYELPFEKYNLPAGYIELKGKTVDIVLTHYPSFDAGRKKWKERMARLDLNNLYILYEGLRISENFLDSFAALPYSNKVVLSKKDKSINFGFYHGMSFYDNWKPGKILEYKSRISVKRYLDDFDYISFLNGKK